MSGILDCRHRLYMAPHWLWNALAFVILLSPTLSLPVLTFFVLTREGAPLEISRLSIFLHDISREFSLFQPLAIEATMSFQTSFTMRLVIAQRVCLYNTDNTIID